MRPPRIVLDTNVLVARLRSRRGASFRLLELVGTDQFEIALSVPLVLEYEDVLNRHLDSIGLATSDIRAVIDYLCSIGHRQNIFYLWRPFLADPKDDLVFELAVAADGEGVVTFNVRDFAGVDHFGKWILTPRDFLLRIGAIA
jgi:predicted nucleic acid-binding protein